VLLAVRLESESLGAAPRRRTAGQSERQYNESDSRCVAHGASSYASSFAAIVAAAVEVAIDPLRCARVRVADRGRQLEVVQAGLDEVARGAVPGPCGVAAPATTGAHAGGDAGADPSLHSRHTLALPDGVLRGARGICGGWPRAPPRNLRGGGVPYVACRPPAGPKLGPLGVAPDLCRAGGPAPQKGTAGRRGHPWPPCAARSGGQPPAGPCAPLHELPPAGFNARRRAGSAAIACNIVSWRVGTDKVRSRMRLA
jgi:hypothetical protein